MKAQFRFSLSLALALILTSCGGEGTSSSGSSITSGSEGSSSSSSSSSIAYPSLEEALENSSTYAVSMSEPSSGWYFEILSPGFSYYDPSGEGLIVLEDDPSFFHAFTSERETVGDAYEYSIHVHGRRGLASAFDEERPTGLLDILAVYLEDFARESESLYACSVASLGNELGNYFYLSTLRYANYFELSIGGNGRLEKLSAYEASTSMSSLIAEIYILDFDLSSFSPYLDWVDGGRKEEITVFDLKGGYFEGEIYRAYYGGEEASVEATVTAVEDGAFYLANEDPLHGSVGLKAKTEGELPDIGDVVKAEGTVELDGYVPYLSDASFARTGERDPYPPIYDEETVVDTYGGGIYAVSFFSQAPYFAGSLYSGYAYVDTLPSMEEGDTVLELICPAFVSSLASEAFHMRLVLPSTLPAGKAEELYEAAAALGSYRDKENLGLEGSFERFIVEFDASYPHFVVLRATADSAIGPKLDFAGKLANYLGLEGFPVMEASSYQSYRFGPVNGIYLEANYGLDEQKASGVYVNASSVTAEGFASWLDALSSYGFAVVDEFDDALGLRHRLFQMGTFVVDLSYIETIFDYENYTLMVYVYEGEMVHGPDLYERFAAAAGSLFPEDFIKVAGTYDADYSHYALLNFAGRDFSPESPLHCFTIDLDSNALLDLVRSYAEQGYSYYRINGTIYTYTTRGSNHYVLFKDLGNGEKYFLDFAAYPTSDYTYAGHSSFAYRIEIMAYEGPTPLSTVYEDDLSSFMDEVARKSEEARFEVDLPAGSKIEFLAPTYGYEYLEYGYYTDPEIFVYGSVKAIQDAFVEGLLAAGYSLTATGKQSVTYTKTIDEASFNISSIVLLPNEQRGFLRVLNGTAGIDF